MSYLLDRRARRARQLKIAAGVLGVLLVFYFRAGISRGLSAAALETFRPMLRAGNAFGAKLGSMGAYFSFKASLARENENLRQELAARDAKMTNYDALLADNANLQKILARAPTEKKLVLAAILSWPDQSPYDTLTVDAGREEGVVSGDLVFANGDIPIGRVNSASEAAAKISLFSAPGEQTHVIVPGTLSGADNGDIFFEVIGRGGGNFEMILPRDFALTEGQQTVLPGRTPSVIAIVRTILSDPRDPFKKALLASPVNVAALKYVEVEVK